MRPAAAAHVRAEERLRWPIVNLELTVAQGDPTLPGTDVIGGLSFLAQCLGANPEVRKRAREEICRVAPGGPLSIAALRDLEYLVVVSEAAILLAMIGLMLHRLA